MKIIKAARSVETIKQELDSVRDIINKKKEAYDSDYARYKSDMKEAFKNVKNRILEDIGSTSVPLTVNVSPDKLLEYVEVDINNGDNPHSSEALSWRLHIEIVNNEVKKESSCWSGLKATTKEDIENLKQTVDVLEKLNNLDWISILSDNIPDYDEYMTGDYYVKDDKELEKSLEDELEDAEIEETSI